MATIDRFNTITGQPTSLGGWIPGDAATGHIKRSVVAWTENLFPQETPFLTALKKGKQVDAFKVEWGSSAELYHTSNTAEAVSASETLIDVTTGHGDRFQVNDMLAVYELDSNSQPDISTKELWWVREINTDTLTVQRGMSGTSAASTFSSGAYIRNLGTALVEADDFTISPTVFGDFLYNYSELIERGHRISEEANQIPTWEYDRGDHIARLMTDAARHAKRNLEDKFFHGERAQGSTTSGSELPSTMGGFPTFIPAANVTNLSGAPVTPYDIETLGATLWESVGDAAAKKLIMSMRTARMFDGILNKYRQATMSDTSVNLQFKSFNTRFGEFDIMPTRTCPEGVIYGVNMNAMSYHAFKDMDWTEKEHSTNGAYKWRSIYGRFTLVVKSPETFFKLYGFSTDLSNYGRTI